MKDRKINFEAWSKTAVQFIRSRGLETEFTDWCGGWPCPVKSEWEPGDTLPVKDEDEKFSVYLAFDNGDVVQADWISYTEYASEFHGSTGVYLGQYPQNGDAYYMTEDGSEVRQDNDGDPWFFQVYEEGKKVRNGPKVIAWMEAVKPLPLHPDPVAVVPFTKTDGAA